MARNHSDKGLRHILLPRAGSEITAAKLSIPISIFTPDSTRTFHLRNHPTAIATTCLQLFLRLKPTGLTLSPVRRTQNLLEEIALADKVGLDVFGVVNTIAASLWIQPRL
jgi:hypothetical protein